MLSDFKRFLCDFRFRWRRRLFIISAPSDEEWAYQQQLYGLNSQACNLGQFILYYNTHAVPLMLMLTK